MTKATCSGPCSTPVTAIVAGIVPETGDADIIRLLKNAGNIIIFAEVAGISEADSPENDRRWHSLMAEKGLTALAKPGCPLPAKTGKSDLKTRKNTNRRHK